MNGKCLHFKTLQSLQHIFLTNHLNLISKHKNVQKFFAAKKSLKPTQKPNNENHEKNGSSIPTV